MKIPVPPLDWPQIKVYDNDFTPCLQKMYEAISELELCDFIRDNPPDKNTGYMFSNESNITRIGNHPKVLDASKKVIRACEKYGKSCGTQISDPNQQNIKEL